MSQEAIGWLLAIYAGAVVGWVTEQLTLSKHGVYINTLAGVLGAALGSLLFSLFGPSGAPVDHLIVGIVFALCVIGLMPKRRRHRKTSSWSRSDAAWKMYAMKK